MGLRFPQVDLFTAAALDARVQSSHAQGIP
jgi:hypothetical protein